MIIAGSLRMESLNGQGITSYLDRKKAAIIRGVLVTLEKHKYAYMETLPVSDKELAVDMKIGLFMRDPISGRKVNADDHSPRDTAFG